MRTVLEERIGGERIRINVTIGVMEAVAEHEDQIVVAMAKLRGGSARLTRTVIVEGLKADGFKGNPTKAYEQAVEAEGFAPLAALAYRALTRFFASASDAEDDAGNGEAATDPTLSASGSAR